MRAPETVALMLVAEHRAWLERRLRRTASMRERVRARPPLAEGRILEVNGIPHRVRVTAADGRARTRVLRVLGSDADGLVGELIVVPGADGRPAPMSVEAWLRAEARRVIEARVEARARAMELTPGPLSIRAQRTRWGSASRDGSLSFNWRLVLAPPFVLDAVVVHELAHLRWRGHGPRFWALARRHAPRTDEARAWLRSHHVELLAALD
jgi:hypothetical protein